MSPTPFPLQVVSDRLLSLDGESMQQELEASLADLGAICRAERVYVFLLSADGARLDRAFEWCAQGVAGHDFSAFGGVPVTAFPWSMERFLRGETVYVRDPGELPASARAERDACEALQIGGYVNVPLFLRERMVGWLGFDSERPNPTWTASDIALMEAAARMLIFTIDRVHREEALRREQAISQHLSALGAFAASLGHEVNNPLAYVSLNLDVLQQELEANRDPELETARRAAAEVRAGLCTLAETVNTLRSFTRRESVSRGPVHLGRVIDATLRLLGERLRLRANLRRVGDDDVWVDASTSELGQILANLLENAVEMLPEGRATDHEIAIRVDLDDHTVAMEVTDTGPGFRPEALERVFEPFFTTKAAGSGIGLALCYALVSNLGGTLVAGNREEGGAYVRMELPRSDAAVPRSTRRRTHPDAPLRVLVIDDLEPLRRVIRLVGERQGHDVHEATDGHSAIQRLTLDRAWDLVLCDLFMPNGTGREVFQYLRAECPELTDRFLFVSGGETEDDARFAEEHGIRLVHKPLTKPQIDALFASAVRLGSSKPTSE